MSWLDPKGSRAFVRRRIYCTTVCVRQKSVKPRDEGMHVSVCAHLCVRELRARKGSRAKLWRQCGQAPHTQRCCRSSLQRHLHSFVSAPISSQISENCGNQNAERQPNQQFSKKTCDQNKGSIKKYKQVRSISGLPGDKPQPMTKGNRANRGSSENTEPKIFPPGKKGWGTAVMGITFK